MKPELAISHLRCEYLDNPLGIDEPRPRLSWIMQCDRRGARQTAWRVIVAGAPENLAAGNGDLWNSGRVESDQSSQIEYRGLPLESRMVCHWRVAIWDENGDAFESKPAFWSMGLLQPSDWQARWIAHDPEIIRRDPDAIEGTALVPGSAPLFRRTFQCAAPVRRATLYVSARGLAEFYLNGNPVSVDCLIPEWSDYNRRLQYRTYDVTNLLVPGANALGALLGDGWWSGYVGWQETRGQYGTLQNSLIAQLEIENQNGELICIGSDRTWKCETGPVLCGDLMLGETYDARRERPGWDQPGYDDANWLPALEVSAPTLYHNPAAALPLVSQRSEPVRVVETLQPVSVHEVRPGVFIYDLGQNIAGFVRLRISAQAGTRMQLRHGERLNPDGTLYTENLRRAKATDVYIVKGWGAEVWQPRFTFHGFQYIEITGIAKALPLECVAGCVLMSATPPAGEFECSHPLVNRLWKNALWSQMGNFLSIPTDCPQRDERLGWMGDAQVFLRTATYNMNVAAFFTKWMIDVCDSQNADGVFPDTAPRLREDEGFVGLDALGGAAGWADAGIIVPFTIWRVYGDRRIIERHWDSMTAWLDWIERVNPRGIRDHELGNNYGDWLCIPADTTFRTQSPMKTLLATAYWAHDAALLAMMASELDKPDEARRFEKMFARVRTAFQNEWLLEDGRLAVEQQTAYLLALAFDLLPENLRSRAAEHLVDNIRNLGWHLSTGFIGISQLNPILTLTGHADVAYRLLLNEDYPSWLYPVLHGATTIWERWNGWTHEDGFFNPHMNSFNHYSLGSVSEWLYRHVAGIELDPDVPGFRRFIIKPHVAALRRDLRAEGVVPGLTHARASYNSIHGKIESGWKLDGNEFTLRITIPANTGARVHVPCDPGWNVLESSKPIVASPVIRSIGVEAGYAIFDVSSGRYEFRSRFSSVNAAAE